MLLSRSVPYLLAGSAVAGFGSSFGRDLYSHGKRNLAAIIVFGVILLALFLPMVGSFLSGRMLARNYETAAESVYNRIVAVAVFVVSVVAGNPPLVIVAILIDRLFNSVTGMSLEMTTAPTFLWTLEWLTVQPWDWVLGSRWTGSPMELIHFEAVKWVLVATVFLAGALQGLLQRKARRQAYEAVEHNGRFMQEKGLLEDNSGLIRDNDGNSYRVHDVSHRRIELFAVGRRNRRAFIEVDPDGKYSSFSGLVKLGS